MYIMYRDLSNDYFKLPSQVSWTYLLYLTNDCGKNTKDYVFFT